MPANGAGPADTRDIFAEKQKLYLAAFEAACNGGKDAKSTATIALAVVIDSDCPDSPVIYSKGGEYDLAKVLASLLRQLTNSIMSKITP